MSRNDLLSLMQRLKPGFSPHYLLLPKAEYTARIQAWGLTPHMP